MREYRTIRTEEEFINEVYSIRKNIKIIGKYRSQNDRIECECLICHYHWFPMPHALLHKTKSKASGCPLCDNKVVIKGINDMWTTDPEIASWLVNPEDGYKYTKSSNKKVDWKCPDCGNIVKSRYINQIHKRRYIPCSNCNDGLSMPMKFVSNVLSQVENNFDTEIHFKWLKNKAYDFYIPGYNTIIEVHGKQHYDVDFSNAGGKLLQDEIKNDNLKMDVALNNNIQNYIVIDARYSELEWIETSILNSKLSNIYDLSNIDFELCFKNAMKSKMVEACELYNNGLDEFEISNVIKVCLATVLRYLRRGVKANICSYDKNYRKQVICLDTNKIFDSMTEASIYAGLSASAHITSCCKGVRKSAGKHPITGKPLHWMYYTEKVS